MHPHSHARSIACTKPRAHTQPITCNIIPQKDTMILYMAQSRYLSNSQVLTIFFPVATIPATSHYPISTDRNSPQYVMLTFLLHFMSNSFFDILPSFCSPLHFHLVSRSYSWPSPIHTTISDHFDIILVIPPPSSLSHSPDLGCVGAQRIIFLGRFLVWPTHWLSGGTRLARTWLILELVRNRCLDSENQCNIDNSLR